MGYRDYDQVLQVIGECGLWQTSLFLLLCVPAALSSISIFIFTFAASTPAHACVGPSNYTPWNDDTGQYTSCSHPSPNSSDVPCSVWVFDDSIFSSTAVEDFSMVCQNSWRKSMAQVSPSDNAVR